MSKDRQTDRHIKGHGQIDMTNKQNDKQTDINGQKTG
jgi:hypothetical protein